jgi:hypothetical protein
MRTRIAPRPSGKSTHGTVQNFNSTSGRKSTVKTSKKVPSAVWFVLGIIVVAVILES